MPNDQLFSDWQTDDLITAAKLNQMKNDLVPWSQVGQANGAAALNANGMPLTAGGAPVIESGANDKGNWVKYADGTLLQYGVTDKVTAAAGTYTSTNVLDYPVAFAAAPVLTATTKHHGGWRMLESVQYNTASQYQFQIYNWDSQQDVWVYWVAIGRWQ